MEGEGEGTQRAVFEDEDCGRAIFGQTVGDGEAGGATADDDVVVLGLEGGDAVDDGGGGESREGER